MDISLPGTGEALGHTHILTQTMQEIISIFEQMGFVTIETPEIETEFHNFTGLNIPIDHPSRDAFDTFYLDAEDPSAQGTPSFVAQPYFPRTGEDHETAQASDGGDRAGPRVSPRRGGCQPFVYVSSGGRSFGG